MKRIIYIATLPARHGSDSQCSQQVALFVQSRCTLQPFSPEHQGTKDSKSNKFKASPEIEQQHPKVLIFSAQESQLQETTLG